MKKTFLIFLMGLSTSINTFSQTDDLYFGNNKNYINDELQKLQKEVKPYEKSLTKTFKKLKKEQEKKEKDMFNILKRDEYLYILKTEYGYSEEQIEKFIKCKCSESSNFHLKQIINLNRKLQFYGKGSRK